jgi:hypothetical protein
VAKKFHAAVFPKSFYDLLNSQNVSMEILVDAYTLKSG